jgi:hypothetical protein
VDGLLGPDLATDGTVDGLLGSGATGIAGDGGPGADAELINPAGLLIDWSAHRALVPDAGAHVIRAVSLRDGSVSRVAGHAGQSADLGDGRLALASTLDGLTGLALDDSGAIYIAEWAGHSARVIRNGNISTVLGPGGSLASAPLARWHTRATQARFTAWLSIPPRELCTCPP